MKIRTDYADKQWLRRPERLQRWQVIAAVVALVLALAEY